MSAGADELETVTVRLEDGTETLCGIVSIFPVQQTNSNFIALNPLDDTAFGRSDEIHLYSLLPSDGYGCYELAEIDQSIFSLVTDEFFRIIEA